MAVLFLCLAMWRSTQLWHALILPPTNHRQNGGLLASSVVSHDLCQSRSSANSRKHSGNLSRAKRSKMPASVKLAWAVNCFGGGTWASSRQGTAICASEVSAGGGNDLSSDMTLLLDFRGFDAGTSGPFEQRHGRISSATDVDIR